MKEEKKLLKGLKTKYFYLLWWRVRRTNEIWKRSRRRKKKKKKEKIRRKAKKQQQEEQKKESEENTFFKYIDNKSKGISNDLFRKYFNFETPNQLAKKLFEIKDKKKNNAFVEEIKNRWSKLKDGIEGCLRMKKKLKIQIK